MKIKALIILLVCTCCVRSKQHTTGDTGNDESFVKDGVVHYTIKDNRIEVDLNNPQKASLFDYFTHIELIPLETNDDVLIDGRRGPTFTFYNNRYYYADTPIGSNCVVYVFDEAGNFIFKLDKTGQGPGEWQRFDKMVINPITENLELLNGFGLLFIYDLQGNHVKTIKVTDSDLLAVHDLVAINEKTYVFISYFHQPYKIIYYDLENMKILHNEYEEERFENHFGGNPFSHYNEQWYFHRVFNNEVYKLGSDSLIKAYSIEFKNYINNIKSIDYDALRQRMREPEGRYALRDAANNFYGLYYLHQNNMYVLVQIRKGEEFYNLMYDKSKQKGKFIENFDESVIFTPVIVNNEYVLAMCNHGELDQYINEEMLDESNRQKLRTLKNAQEEQNPIILKYYFK